MSPKLTALMQRAWLIAALWSLSPSLAYAADWLTLQSTEQGRADRGLLVWGFAQLMAEGILAEPVGAALLTGSSLEGRVGDYASGNVLAGEDTLTSFSVRRLRLGVRGAIPQTDQSLTYFVSAEFGQNALTEASAVRLVDASITFDLYQELRVRVGQFKLPLSDETLESNILTGDVINLSNVVLALLHERSVEEGVVRSGAGGTRDTGVQLSGALVRDHLELTWALGLTNGRQGALDDNNSKDLSARVQLAIIDPEADRLDPERSELAVYLWGLTGGRDIDRGRHVQRTRAGGGLQWRPSSAWRLRVEGLWGQHALILTDADPFAGAPRQVYPDGEAWGATALLSFRPVAELELNAMVNRLETRPGDAALDRIGWEQVLGAQYFFRPHVKLFANGALRQSYAPSAPEEVGRALSTLAPRLSLQLSWTF
jgi:hypothetical protein